MLTVSGIMVAGLGGTAIIFWWSDSRRLRRLRRQHLQSHIEMSDADFLATANVPVGAGDAACRVRQAIAKAMKVPAATVHPTDDLSYISAFGLDGMDWVEIEIDVEQEAGCRVPAKIWDEFWKRQDHRDVAGLIELLFSGGWLPAKSRTSA